MKIWVSSIGLSAVVGAVCAGALGQAGPAIAQPASATEPAAQVTVPAASGSSSQTASESPSAGAQALLAFRDSDVKFSIDGLMDILQDKRHEGWVLAAYPDPKTSQPLIGAGFSLDLPARDHPQTDPLNPNAFVEPSSADLWAAAGLDPAELTTILNQFHAQLDAWTARRFRSDIRYLPAQISEDDAQKLLRIGIVQAAVNARAYCRNFDRLTASQQMALTQLVYQMGVNLEEFTEFRGLINDGFEKFATPDEPVGLRTAALRVNSMNAEYWKTVQQSLTHSQWARLYRSRAVAVIAMLDPSYAANPTTAERRVSAVLRPAYRGRSRRSAAASTELAAAHTTHRSTHGRRARAAAKKTA